MRGGPGADRETELRGVPAAGGVSGYPEVWGGILPERVHGESRQVNFDLEEQTEKEESSEHAGKQRGSGLFSCPGGGGKFGFSGLEYLLRKMNQKLV